LRYANFRRDVWNGAVAAAGLVRVKPHDLRASHASWLIDRGFSVMDVAARLGHSSAAVTTRYYARPMAGRDQDIAARSTARK
jgi:integrase